jgi:PAS domain S-box-containing protein
MPDRLHILNLEDNVADAELNEAMLSARWPECRLVRVDNRADFLAALEQGELDVILSDYTMPGFSGLEALTLARQKRPAIPFLFVSGTIGEDTAIEALKNGATDYVLKHRLMRLIPAVDRALREVAQRVECQRAEEIMRQSEHKYRELFESLEDAAFLADAESGKIIDVNRSAEKLLGCSRSEILGRKQSVFLMMGESAAPPPAPTASLSGSSLETLLLAADGTALPVSVHLTHLTLYECRLALRLCRALPGQRRGSVPAGSST